MPRRRSNTNLPKSIWVVFARDEEGAVLSGAYSVYTDPEDIGELDANIEVAAHYYLKEKK